MSTSAPGARALSMSRVWTALIVLALPVIAHAAGQMGATAAQIDWRWGVKIPMRDGVHLNATLYRPRDQSGPLPCIFTLTPYIADRYHERGSYFARNGYVFVLVDVRGRGNSEGEFRPLRDAPDGHDVVEWLARQSYCNGKIAMWGGSYAGTDQWQTASQHPPHLVTIVPAAAAFVGVDFPMQGNIRGADEIQWLTLTSDRAFQGSVYSDAAFWVEQFSRRFVEHRPYAQLDQSIGIPSATFREWVAHPELDAYWDSYSPSAADYAAMDFPILTITGQYDGDQEGALEHYRRHLQSTKAAGQEKHFLIIGPWDHDQTRTPTAETGGLTLGEASVLDLNELHRQWYDWTMKSGARPEFLKKAVAFYVTSAERWRYADTLQAVTRTQRPMYLASQGGRANDVFHSGSLQAEIPRNAPPDSYLYDPLDVSNVELIAQTDNENLREQRHVLRSNGKALIYHSPPFEQDIEVSGFFNLRAWLAIDQPDTDFAASVYEIAADGTSLLLSRMQMRARYRESLRVARLVPRGEPLEYRFERFSFVARRIAAGSRLRLVIAPVNSPYLQKNYNSGGIVAHETAADGRTVTVKLLHDARHPSALYVPIGDTVE